MLTNQHDTEQFARNSSWTVTDFSQEPHRVVRKYINSAIYVEKEVSDMAPQRKTSCLLDSEPFRQEGSSNLFDNYCGQHIARSNAKKNSPPSTNLIKVDIENGSTDSGGKIQKTPESGYRTMEQSSNSSNEHSENSYPSESTIKPGKFNENFNTELRLSLTCLQTNRTSTLDPKERQEIVQNWMTRKEAEKKRKAQLEAKAAKAREEERQKLIERERQNFTRWLAEKKKEEEKKKALKELKAEEEKQKVAEREKKKEENETIFNLWLRRKRKDDLEKKITEKIALINMYEDKQKRMEDNEKAYQEWLENSRNRQRPIPMNKGLQSLCSSASVTYINPIPWKPNIDPNCKPLSQ